MQVIVLVHCTRGSSLRDSIVSRLGRSAEPDLVVSESRREGRNPGWTKIHSADKKRGAINVQWVTESSILQCRVVTRRTREISPIVGDFVTYLLDNHRSRIKAITLTSL